MLTIPQQSADHGLKYYDQAVGTGEVAEKGKKVKVGVITEYSCVHAPVLVLHQQVAEIHHTCMSLRCQGAETDHVLLQVHFDCMYKGIDVVSSRQARLLGGNRTISEVSI